MAHLDEEIKVLYVGGEGRSGSTLLGNVIGQVDGFFHGGEIRYLWLMALNKSVPCGCGVPIRECSLWRDVIHEAFGGLDRKDAEEMVRLHEGIARTKYLPRMLLPGGRDLMRTRLRAYVLALGKLYHAIRTVTGCRVIIDSSKHPMDMLALQMISEIDLRVIHLVRDARAVAYSWTRKKEQPGTGEMMRYNPFRSAFHWNVSNLATQFMPGLRNDMYMRVRYEDFIAKPREAVTKIIAFANEKQSSCPFLGPSEVDLTMNHGIYGNPLRFLTGRIPLRLDQEWVVRMNPWYRTAVTFMTWPLLFQYGYSIR